MNEESIRRYMKDVFHVVVLLALLLFLLGLLTWSGILGCSVIPGWCEVYWMFTGEPRTLIAYGDSGLGDHELLQYYMQHPQYLGLRVDSRKIDYLALGNLKQYDLVIVTEARKMSTQKMKMFVDYALEGGKLVWTGDAGAELAEGDEFIYRDDEEEGAAHEIISPWARRDLDKTDGNYGVFLNRLLSLDYVTNYCLEKKCTEGKEPWIGMFRFDPGEDHKLVLGLDPTLQLYGDFAIVRERGDRLTTIVLSVDALAIITTEGGGNLGKVFPIIVTSGVGEKVVYYAVPLENYLKESQGGRYSDQLLRNMYYGMIK